MSAPSPATLRPATSADLDTVVTLWFGLMEHHRRLNDRFWQPRENAGEIMRAWLGEPEGDERRCLLVAEVEGEVAGFIHGQLTGGPPPMVPRCDGEISDLYVAPAFRRQGLARALVGALTGWFAAHGADKVLLSAAVQNPEAVGFWTSQGFEPLLYRMWKPLS